MIRHLDTFYQFQKLLMIGQFVSANQRRETNPWRLPYQPKVESLVLIATTIPTLAIGPMFSAWFLAFCSEFLNYSHWSKFQPMKILEISPGRHACSFERNNRRSLELSWFQNMEVGDLIGRWKVRVFRNRSYAPKFGTVTKASWNAMNHFDFRSRCIIKFCQV